MVLKIGRYLGEGGASELAWKCFIIAKLSPWTFCDLKNKNPESSLHRQVAWAFHVGHRKTPLDGVLLWFVYRVRHRQPV